MLVKGLWFILECDDVDCVVLFVLDDEMGILFDILSELILLNKYDLILGKFLILILLELILFNNFIDILLVNLSCILLNLC